MPVLAAGTGQHSPKTTNYSDENMKGSLRTQMLGSSIYLSGNTFTTSDAVRHIECDAKQIAGALTSMIDRGELVVTQKSGNSTTYQRPMKGLLRMPWVPAVSEDYLWDIRKYRR